MVIQRPLLTQQPDCKGFQSNWTCSYYVQLCAKLQQSPQGYIDSRDTVWAAACHLKTDHAQKTQIGDDHTSEDETQKQLDTF